MRAGGCGLQSPQTAHPVLVQAVHDRHSLDTHQCHVFNPGGGRTSRWWETFCGRLWRRQRAPPRTPPRASGTC